jgi:hypothetical protein
MVDAQKLLAALAHAPLRSEQILRRGLISHERIRRDIAQAIDRLRPAASAADQSTTFRRA